jgi:hypothetical protein
MSVLFITNTIIMSDNEDNQSEFKELKSEISELKSEMVSLRYQLRSSIDKLNLSLSRKSDVKRKDYSEYNDIFDHPDTEQITITFDPDHFKQLKLDKLHKFLIEINYEPYVMSKQDLLTYCTDLGKHISIYLTYQSYINNLIYDTYDDGDARMSFTYKYGKPISFTLLFDRDYDVCVKYDISPDIHKAESYKYGYNKILGYPWNTGTIYIKKIVY